MLIDSSRPVPTVSKPAPAKHGSIGHGVPTAALKGIKSLPARRINSLVIPTSFALAAIFTGATASATC
jgi:hypothetical protein